ncbi:hypothetical protein PO909_016005 [Leuciscus waleckii]
MRETVVERETMEETVERETMEETVEETMEETVEETVEETELCQTSELHLSNIHSLYIKICHIHNYITFN